MSIIQSKLSALYEKNQEFEGMYPLKETTIKLESFITSELMQGKSFINHKRLSLSCGYDEGKTLVLLMAIGSMKDNGLLNLLYEYTLPSGKVLLCDEDETKEVVITTESSQEEMTLYEAIITDKVDAILFFEIDENIKKQILGNH